MGGCCCSSRKHQLHGTPVYYYYPRVSEEHESLASVSAISNSYLIDLNLDTSVPDTYRPPPAPIPFDVVLGRPELTNLELLGEPVLVRSVEKTTAGLGGSEFKAQILLASPKKGVELLDSDPVVVPAIEEEDVCPTCLEDYDAENPRINTKCNHHFHLSCILEWMERSETCPICDQEMSVQQLVDKYACCRAEVYTSFDLLSPVSYQPALLFADEIEDCRFWCTPSTDHQNNSGLYRKWKTEQDEADGTRLYYLWIERKPKMAPNVWGSGQNVPLLCSIGQNDP